MPLAVSRWTASATFCGDQALVSAVGTPEARTISTKAPLLRPSPTSAFSSAIAISVGESRARASDSGGPAGDGGAIRMVMIVG